MRGKVNNNYTSFNRIKFYYGLVVSVDINYNIRFRIPELLDNLADEEYPIAHPILKHTSEIRPDDNVLIMQLDEDIQDFVYFSNDTTTFTGIEFGNNRIDISDGKNIYLEHVTNRNDSHEPESVSSRVTISDKEIKAEIMSEDSVLSSMTMNSNSISANITDNGKVIIDRDKITISNSLFNLGAILKDLLDVLIGLKTVGSPATQALSPDLIVKLTKIQLDLSGLLSKEG